MNEWENTNQQHRQIFHFYFFFFRFGEMRRKFHRFELIQVQIFYEIFHQDFEWVERATSESVKLEMSSNPSFYYLEKMFPE